MTKSARLNFGPIILVPGVAKRVLAVVTTTVPSVGPGRTWPKSSSARLVITSSALISTLAEIVPVSLRALPGIITAETAANTIMKTEQLKALIYDNRVERFPNFIEFRLLALLFALVLIVAVVKAKTYSFLQIPIHQELVLLFIRLG